MKNLVRLLLSALPVLVIASAGHAQIFDALLHGSIESPPNASPATGNATITFDLDAHTMHVQASFSGLIGTTTASHIHAATVNPFAGNAGVATTLPTFTSFPLGVQSGTYDHVFDMTLASSYNPAFVTANGGTTASAEQALFAAAVAGKSYLNIHTNQFPAGEIRGFLFAAPEPTSLALFGGFALVGAIARRRRR